MARLPALIDTYAAFDGRERKAVKHIARTIQTAGYIATTKRGSGASAMSERDAVNLLLGANGAETAAGAVPAVDRLRQLRLCTPEFSQSATDLNLWRDQSASTPWRELMQFDRFGDAMDWMVLNAEALQDEIVKCFNATLNPRDEEHIRFTFQEVEAKLTIGRAEAWFEVFHDHAAFPSIRLSYQLGFFPRPKDVWRDSPYRRLFAELDFEVIVGLSRAIKERGK